MYGGRADALALSALGGAVRYLKRLLLDRELLSLGEIELLPTPGGGCAWDGRAAAGGLGGGRAMALDAQILSNSADGGRRGTLLDTLDRTCTLWGRR
ncbi:hypothetical protein T492DRAFT_863143 [Pavlovales sp. CCMP2436]|nr:hypothetical protein T492DRAFT_863143 [Pavlovales sp. CCMP2436]